MIKRFIFDVDKTLIGGIDFSPTVEKVLKKHDLYSKSNVERFVEAMLTYESTHDYYSKAEYIDHINKYIDGKIYIDTLNDYFKELRYCVPDPIIGAEDTLKRLKNKEYEIVALTNFFAVSQRSRLETLGLAKYISKIYGEHACKPTKTSYLDACENNRVDECVMVGDNYAIDVVVPNYLGLKTIYVTGSDKQETNNFVEVNTIADIDDELIKRLK